MCSVSWSSCGALARVVMFWCECFVRVVMFHCRGVVFYLVLLAGCWCCVGCFLGGVGWGVSGVDCFIMAVGTYIPRAGSGLFGGIIGWCEVSYDWRGRGGFVDWLFLCAIGVSVFWWLVWEWGAGRLCAFCSDLRVCRACLLVGRLARACC